MEADGWGPPDDEIANRFRALEDRLRSQLEGSAVVRRRPDFVFAEAVEVAPSNPNCLPLWWAQEESEVIVEVGVAPKAGRWEFLRGDVGVEFVEDAAAAVIAGTATHVFGPGRSCVRVPLRDGTYATSINGWGALLFPAPGWRRWGRTVTHAPYRP